MAGPSPKRLCILGDVSGVRIKSRLEMLAPQSFGFPGEKLFEPNAGVVGRTSTVIPFE
jgi:hypothetical protein